MLRRFPPAHFADEWARYLRGQGHRVRTSAAGPEVVCSRNGRGRRYRWLLVASRTPVRRLTAAEHEAVLRQIDQGRARGEQVFVVVKFDPPINKVVALSASRAAKASHLRASKGGIPWND